MEMVVFIFSILNHVFLYKYEEGKGVRVEKLLEKVFLEGKKAVQNIVFDLGRVLIDYDPQTFLDSLFGRTFDTNKLKPVVFQSPEWAMLDRGVINQAQAVERLGNQYPELAEHIRIVFDNWFSMLTPIESSVEWVTRLHKQGYSLYVLSNFHREAFSYVRGKYSWFHLFDGMVISYQVHALKPEPAIYEALLRMYQLEPESCLFIDDVLANIEGAQQMGIKGIQYKNPEQMSRDLVEVLGR